MEPAKSRRKGRGVAAKRPYNRNNRQSFPKTPGNTTFRGEIPPTTAAMLSASAVGNGLGLAELLAQKHLDVTARGLHDGFTPIDLTDGSGELPHLN
jgi:hypothetical protein